MEPDKESLMIKIFADGANLEGMIEMAKKSYISGLTTNPTLMKKAGISDYARFAKDAINAIPTKPISFEVFSDDLDEMFIQAQIISSWGDNVYVKIPVSNTRDENTTPVIEKLVEKGVKVNVTALMTKKQVEHVVAVLDPNLKSYISVFAGRIADTGRDPVPIMRECVELLSSVPSAELIWASPRELLNVFQADAIGCHIITATSEILNKMNLVGYSLEKYSLDTVCMFHNDALEAGYKI